LRLCRSRSEPLEALRRRRQGLQLDGQLHGAGRRSADKEGSGELAHHQPGGDRASATAFSMFSTIRFSPKAFHEVAVAADDPEAAWASPPRPFEPEESCQSERRRR